MLKELSKVEQRYDAVLAVIRDGMRVTEVAEKYGVHRDTVHTWLARYEAEGLAGLTDRSHRPKHSPLQIPAAVEARILELRRWRPHWGPASIRHQLGRESISPLPSLSAIYRALVRHHLIEPRSSRKRLPAYKRWERGSPMELWQMDIVGGVLLDDGTECKVLTGIDDHSRYCVCAGVMPADRFSARVPDAPPLPLDLRSITEDRTGDDWVTRRVASTGVISVAWQVFSVGKHRAGEIVEVKVGENLLEVWSSNELIKAVLRTSKGGIRKKRAQRPGQI